MPPEAVRSPDAGSGGRNRRGTEAPGAEATRPGAAARPPDDGLARLIDVHSHHYPDAYLEPCRRPGSGLDHYVRDDGRLVILQDGAVAAAVPQPLPGPSHRLGLMDEAGVAVQVLSISAPNVFRLPAGVRAPLTRDLNDELAAMADGASGRLRVFADLPLPDVDQSLAELDRVLGRDGMVGVMVCTTIDRRTLDDGLFGPLWEELDRRSAAVFEGRTGTWLGARAHQGGPANARHRGLWDDERDGRSGRSPSRWAFGFGAVGSVSAVLAAERANYTSVPIERARRRRGGQPVQHEPQTPQLVVSPHKESEIDDAKEAIRRDRAHRQLRAALLEGANSPVAGDADAAYFKSLRKSVETGI